MESQKTGYPKKE